MTRRQSNNQWSGGITAHPAPNYSECKNPLKKLSPRFFGIKKASSSLIIFQREYYSSMLLQLKDILKEKSHTAGRSPRGLFLARHCPPHRALANKKKLPYLAFQCLDYPPYSPDLAPSDYHLFPGLKKQLKCRHFSSEAEVIAAAETWLDEQFLNFFELFA